MFYKFVSELKNIKNIKKPNISNNLKIDNLADNHLLINNHCFGFGIVNYITDTCKKHNYTFKEFRTSQLSVFDFVYCDLLSRYDCKNIREVIDTSNVVIFNRTSENTMISNIIDDIIYKRKLNNKPLSKEPMFIELFSHTR